jgi:hypothetical protein
LAEPVSTLNQDGTSPRTTPGAAADAAADWNRATPKSRSAQTPCNPQRLRFMETPTEMWPAEPFLFPPSRAVNRRATQKCAAHHTFVEVCVKRVKGFGCPLPHFSNAMQSSPGAKGSPSKIGTKRFSLMEATPANPQR